jgi:hypothetical protein
MERMDTNALYALVGPVRRILLERWDPIGVKGIPEAVDEYDSYIPGVVALLQQTADPLRVAAYLERIAQERMGTSPSHAPGGAAALELVSLFSKVRSNG